MTAEAVAGQSSSAPTSTSGSGPTSTSGSASTSTSCSCSLLLLLREWIIGTGWDARLVAVNVGASGFEGVADTALRHPGGGGDRAVGRSARTQPTDGRDRVAGEFRLAFGALAFRQQPGHTRVGVLGVPASHRGRAHRERLGDLSWVAALIRISDTAANRRPAVSPASQA